MTSSSTVGWASATALLLLSTLLLTQSFHLAPTDVQAAWAWNSAMALAALAALLVQIKYARENGLSIPQILTVTALVNVALVIGSRLGAWTGMDWQHALAGERLPVLPGKTIIGGFLMAGLLYFALRKWWRLSPRVADALLLSLPLAAAIGRLGCLTAGCCYGTLSTNGLGIAYGPGTPAFEHQLHQGLIAANAAYALPVVPIQAIQVLCNLAIFLVLWLLRKKLPQAGALTYLAAAMLMAQRFGIEFFREVATNRGGFGLTWGGLKLVQGLLLLGCLASATALGRLLIARRSSPTARLTEQTAVHDYLGALLAILISVSLWRNLLTLDEIAIIIIAWLPAAYAVARGWYHRPIQSTLTPAALLSATALGIWIINPLDTIHPVDSLPQIHTGNNKGFYHWWEVGAGGLGGHYDIVSRDCGGNVIDRDRIRYRSFSSEINTYWQDKSTRYQVGLCNAWGQVESADRPEDYNQNHRYFSWGARAGIQARSFGLWLGMMQNTRVPTTTEGKRFSSLTTLGMIRFGKLDRFFVNLRINDDPVLGAAAAPTVALGLFNWGFKDPTGSTFMGLGFANGRGTEGPACYLTTLFPLAKTNLSLGANAYWGGMEALGLSMRWRLGQRGW